ncbi:unnamed protein product [Cyprideis torosa]|uniref:Uncharacterized protein n=1 Tax=Cyprideis torosa TaxID=163714 RepID=A0A7R8WAX5_9CRUS|nr:unnamed protein product [Cyprideis torosa]CAG0891516.1 unnamed protein product [Cyprideis torosa]
MQKSSIGKAKTKSSVGDSSVSSDSLVDATGSRGASPDLPPPLTRPLSDAAMTGGGPKRPGSSMSVQTGYKKRPAPRPPSFIEGTKVVSNSSDASSGFHEGDRARSPDGFPSSNHSGPPQVAPTNLKGSLSTSSLSLASSSGGRSKRRAPPPPKVSHPTGTARSLSTPSSNTPPSAASPRRSTTLPASSSLPSPEEEATPIAPPSASSPSPSPSFSSEHSSTVSVSATDPSLPPSPRPADPVEGGQSPHTPPTPGPAHSLPHRNKRRAPLPPPLRSPTPNSPVLPASDRARPVPRERAPSDVPGLNPRPPMLRSDSVRSASGSESESPTSRGDLGKWSGVLTDLSAIGEEPVVTLPQNRANSKPDEEEQARTMSLSSEEEEDEPLSELPPPPRESPTPPPITAEETPSAGESPMPPPITTEKTPSAVESPTPPPTTAEETPSQRERQTPSPITAEEDKGVAEESVQPEEEIVNVFRNREAEDLDSSRVSDIFEELERSIGEEPPTPSPASSKKTDGGARTPSRLLETPSTGITTDSEEEEEDQVVASSSPLPRKQLSREDFFDVLIPPLPNDQFCSCKLNSERFSPIPSTVIKRDRAFPKDFEDPGMIRHADADYADDQWESVGSFYIQPGRVVEDLTLPVHEEMEVMEEDRMEEDEEEEERSLTPSIVAVAPPVEFKDPSPLPPSSSEGSEVEDDDFSPRPDSGASIQDSGVAELGSDRIRASSVSSCDSTSAPTSDGGMATPPKSATPPARPTAPKPNTAPARSISFQIRPYSSENVPRVVTVARDLPTSVPAEPVKPPGQPNPQVEEAASIVIRPYEPWKKTGLLVTKQDSGSDPLPNSEVREPLVTANMNRSKSIPSSTFPRPLKKQPESMIETSTFPRKSEPSSSGTPFGSRMMNRPWVVRKSNAFNKSGLLSSSTLDLSSRPKEFVPMDPALELERGRLSLRHVELPPWQQEEQEPSEPSTPSPKQSVEQETKQRTWDSPLLGRV